MLEILQNRRSVRKFTEQKIEDEKIESLKKALLLSPTSRNLEPCEFIMVRNKETLEKLSKLKSAGSSFIAGCDTAFVICGDTEKSDVCIEDCSIASIVLQLTAETLGLKSCWAQVRLRSGEKPSEEYVKELLDLPDSFTVVSVIGIGYPAEEREPRSDDTLKTEKIHAEKF